MLHEFQQQVWGRQRYRMELDSGRHEDEGPSVRWLPFECLLLWERCGGGEGGNKWVLGGGWEEECFYRVGFKKIL